jgi:hypothetical protein
LESGDEQAADDTEDKDVALHDAVAKKYTRCHPQSRVPHSSRCSMSGIRQSTGLLIPRHAS